MTALEAQALLPYLALAGGIVLVLVLVAWLRSARVAFGGGLAVLAATLALVPVALEAGPQTIDGLLRIDGFALFFVALFALAAIVTALLSHRYLASRARHLEEFHILLLIATLGAATTAAAVHFAGFLLGLEVLSVSLYAMIAYPREGRAPLEASLKYLVLSGAASSTILFGMALVYTATGSLAFETSAEVASAEAGLLRLGQGMLLAGVFFKLSLVPFHMWTPDVYQGAPAPVAGFVATVSKGAVAAVLLRYAIGSDVLEDGAMRSVLVAIAVLSMIGGNLLALLQDSVKRLLAYSSIAHLGYLLIAVAVAGTPAGRDIGVETALVYLFGYFAMTLAAFGVVTVLSPVPVEARSPTGRTDGGDEADALAALEGLLWRRPLPGAVLVAAALSLAGIPLTVGFIAKFYLVAAGVDGAAWTLLWALIIGSAIGVYYYLRIVFATLKRPEQPAPAVAVPWEGLATVAVLGAAMLVAGVYPAPLIDFVQALSGP